MEITETQNIPGATVSEPARPNILARHHLGLILLVIITLALHFLTITNPPEPLFDEIHYVTDARSIIAGQGDLRPEHPPLGKLLVAAGIQIFGDNPVGWRIFPIIFGTVSIVLFYFICRRLKMSQRATLLATTILAFENMTFLQASVAMLDVFSLTFMLAAFLFYLSNRYMLSSLGVALGALAKLFGALALLAIVLHWLFSGRPRPKTFIASVILSGVLFLGLMSLFDLLISPGWQSPITQTKTMLDLSSSLTFANVTHPALSRPWMWIIPVQGMWYWYDPNYLEVINVTVSALIIPAIVYMIIRARKNENASIFGLAWFVGTYVVWIPISLLTNRVSFIFYFYPTVGALCIGIGLGLAHLWEWAKTRTERKKRAIIGGIITYLVINTAFFVVVAPFNHLINLYQLLVAG